MKKLSPRRAVRSSSPKPKLFAAVVEELEQRRMLAANLVISEFLASNSAGLTDHAGDHPDWIEIHNAGDATATLNNYFLTDDVSDPEKWRFPVGPTLAAGGYMYVFADSSVSSVVTWSTPTPGTEYHTNFSLSASGEYLGLNNAADDSVQFAYAPTFPAQSTDISYGLSNENDPSSAKAFFTTPTPGAVNTPSAISTTFSIPSETYTGTLHLTLSSTTPGAQIYYTTNGKVPSFDVNGLPINGTTLYSSILSLTNTTMLRTVVHASGYNPSPVASQSYLALSTSTTTNNVNGTGVTVSSQLGTLTVGAFTSNLPIVTINTFSSTSLATDAGSISQTTDTGAIVSFTDTVNGVATLLGTPGYVGRAGVHVRGSTSANYAKKQFSIELWDETNNDKKTSILGMPSDSDWVLYAPYTEKTMMSNALAYKWSTEMGHYASRTEYVEVFLDTQNAGTLASGVAPGGTSAPTTGQTYVGIYILEEKIKISSDRVNVDAISPTNLNGGWIVAQDRNDGGAELSFTDDTLDTTGVHTPVNIIYAEPDKSDLGTVSNPEAVKIKSDWNAFVDALFNSSTTVGQRWTDASATNANYYGNYIDVKSFVDFYLLNEMTRNIDSFWLSTYFNKAADTVVNGTVTQRGLISAGPVWDFNLAFGAANYNYSGSVSGWDTDTLSPAPGAPGVGGFNPQDPYFQKLLTDPNFKLAVADRWAQLRSTYFATPQLMADIDANVAILSNGNTNYPIGSAPSQSPIDDPIVRNFIRWPELGVDVTTEGLYDPKGTWDGTISPLTSDVGLAKSWLTARVNWMDSQFVPKPIVTPGGSFGGPVTVTMTPVSQTTVSDGTTLIAPNSSLATFFPTTTGHPTDPGNDIANWQTLDPTTLSAPWVTRQMPIGYSASGNDVNFNPFISTAPGSDVGSIMRSSQTSTPANDVYVLANFSIPDASAVQGLVFRAQTDDALVIWVNGVRAGEIAMGGTQNPVWNSAAPSSGNDTLAITFREFDLAAIKPYLKNGNNTLAIQGENSGTGSTDFLLNPSLYTRVYTTSNAGTVYYTTDGNDPRPSGGGAPIPSAIAYSSSITINATTEIRARTRYADGSWSALSDNLYTIGADALRITEIMYNPPDPSANELQLDPSATAQDYEFIEFENTGSTMLTVGGYQLTTGVTFTFPAGGQLAPGGYGVVVKNPTAFAVRYPNIPASAILGTYSGNLNNDGEPIAFQNGNNVVVQSFTYSDSWYKTQTDGHGYSLVIRNPLDATLSDWGTVGAWRASYLVNGLPGQSDVDNTPPTAQLPTYSTGSIGVNFSELVNITNPSNATLTDLVTGNSFNPTGFTMNGNTATFTIPTLGDGLYSFILPAASVTDSAANQIGANVIYGMVLLAAGHLLQLPSTSSTYTVNQVSMGAASTLDLKNDTLLYKGGTLGTWGGSSYSGMTGLIASGRNGGAWNGTGIISSTTTAGVFSDVGIASNAGTLTIKRTFAGDANLDSVLNGDDYFQIDSHPGLNGGAVNYAAGDFDFNGKVNADDYFLLDSNYNKGQTPLNAPPLALQPIQTAGAQPPKAAALIPADTSAWDRLSDDSDLI